MVSSMEEAKSERRVGKGLGGMAGAIVGIDGELDS